MIRRPTVFVLGAGASQPYGFPSGGELARAVLNAVTDSTELRNRLLGFFDASLMHQFRQAFRHAGRDSLDAFVNSRRDYVDLVKHAIVLKLAEREIEDNLFPDSPQNDWCRYLFNRMIHATPEEFRANQLKVITFNFDRSFERRLFLALKGNFNLSDRDTADLAAAIPVLHIHGQLGAPAWCDDGRTLARHYTVALDQPHLPQLASQIRIVHEEVSDSAQLATAHQWLRGADVVAFLGFGFHPINVARLLPGFQGRSPETRATALGMTQAERDPVARAFAPLHVHFVENDSVYLLRHTGIVHND